MARSSYIYIVMWGGNIEAAFTVKHEMEMWLAANNQDGAMEVWRTKDNPPWRSENLNPTVKIFPKS